MKVALVHDHLAQDGGAEKVLKVFCEMFPDAPIYTLLYDKKNAEKYYSDRKIETSIIQKLPGGIKHYKWYLPFMPMAVEFFDLSEYDLVLSDASAFAKGVITSTKTLHISYCHSPTRYLWSDTHQYINELKYNKYFKKIIGLSLNKIRVWDRSAADRVDKYVANSGFIAKRIEKYYRRSSFVIYPPVNVDIFNVSNATKSYYLIGGRLAPYKRVDLVIEAFNNLNTKKNKVFKLKIFGDGIDYKRLKGISKDNPNIEFLGRVSDTCMAKLYAECIAFINPQEEDFGITAIEAMASGRPVIAYRAGGAVETIREGVTGEFFDVQNSENLLKVLEKFDERKFNSMEIRSYAKKFSTARFKQEIFNFIESKMTEWKKNT